ncbi:hypothetical protein CB0940_10457 [Cercospora beticola]|uniref:Uncharacterized protein n=1 Tax=Cercospora beticola TaxID=122368 RepID=A0A2G5HTM2_CERBT|nr:hypothetical protein CB0940_10457 [Cercospora beticola]PIA95894.1 hypothetical protein CB0940_10457 [Cercospora beticola]WPB07175.1 hypothetical protein RHO25_011835 [Cercospora beticola]CAK1367134.1 unnamed protein product [Cercospora beticola]
MFYFSKSRATSPLRQSSPKHTKADVEWIMVDEDTPSEQQNGVQPGKSVETSKHHHSSTDDQKSNAKTKEPASTSASSQRQTKQLKSGGAETSSEQTDLATILSSLSSQRSEISTMQTSLLEAQAQIQEERDLFQAQYYALRNQQEERDARQAEEKKQEWKDDLETLRLEMTVRAMSEEERVEKLMLQMETVVKKVDDMQSSGEKKVKESEKTLEMLGNSIEQLAMGMQHLGETVSKIQAMYAEKFEAAEKDRKDLQAQFLRLEKDVKAIRQDKSLATQNQLNIDTPSHTNFQQPLNPSAEPYLGPRPFPKGPTSSTSSPSASNPPRRRHHRTSHPDHTFNANIRPRGRLDLADQFSQMGLGR